MFGEAGFVDIRVLRDFDYFAISPSDETKSVASRFGARAIEITCAKAQPHPTDLRSLRTGPIHGGWSEPSSAAICEVWLHSHWY